MDKLIKWLVILTVAYYAVANFISPIAFSEDTHCGLMCIKNYVAGGSFNTIQQPQQQNLAADKEVFVTTWAPGHYVFPFLFLKLLPLSIGHAYLLAALVCLLLGIAGIYKLLKKLELPEHIIWITILLVIVNRSTFNTNFYNLIMGELLAFAALPWYVLLFLNLNNTRIRFFFIISACTFLMIMIKLSLAIACLAVTSAFAIKHLHNRNLRSALLLCVPVVLAFLAFIFYFQRKGTDASKLQGGFYTYNKYENAFVATAAPMAAQINFSDIEEEAVPKTIRMFYFKNKLLIYLILALITLAVLYRVRVYAKEYEHLFLLFYSFYIVYGLAYFYFTWTERWMDYTYRHFRFQSMLFIPIVLLWLHDFYRWRSRWVYVWTICLFTYGLGTFTYKKFVINANAAKTKDDYALNYIDNEAYRYLTQLDDSLRQGNNLFFVNNPEGAYLIKNNRQMICLDIYSACVKYGWTHYQYNGKVDNLYVFCDKRFLKLGDGNNVLKNLFLNYTLSPIKTTANFVVYKGIIKN
jgi:hypothetical protein